MKILAPAVFDDTVDVVKRRCSSNLASPGWYRVLKFNNTNSAYLQGATGAEIDLHITRRRTNVAEETHTVKILFGYNDIVFADEVSACSDPSYFRIDKVRYTYSAEAAYIDIHAADVCPAVAVSFGVYTEADRLSMYTAESLQAVADSPSGETVLTTYTFAANGSNLLKSIYISKTTTSGAFTVFDDVFTAKSKVQATVRYFSSMTSIGYFVTVQPTVGKCNFYIRTPGGGLPADGSQIDLCILIDNR